MLYEREVPTRTKGLKVNLNMNVDKNEDMKERTSSKNGIDKIVACQMNVIIFPELSPLPDEQAIG